MTGYSSLLVTPFDVDVTHGREEVVVALSGELDLGSAHVLEQQVAGLRDAGHDHVVVDLSRIEFIDSTGLRVLIGLHKAAEHEGRALSLVPGPRSVQRIFEMTATDPLFRWRD